MAKASKPAKEEKQKVKLTVTQVKKDLADGIDRDGIAEKYALTKGDVKKLFQHPALKGLKVKTAPGFELEDDTQEEDDAAGETETATASASTSEGAAEQAASGEEVKEVAEPASKQKGVW